MRRKNCNFLNNCIVVISLIIKYIFLNVYRFIIRFYQVCSLLDTELILLILYNIFRSNLLLSAKYNFQSDQSHRSATCFFIFVRIKGILSCRKQCLLSPEGYNVQFWTIFPSLSLFFLPVRPLK